MYNVIWWHIVVPDKLQSNTTDKSSFQKICKIQHSTLIKFMKIATRPGYGFVSFFPECGWLWVPKHTFLMVYFPVLNIWGWWDWEWKNPIYVTSVGSPIEISLIGQLSSSSFPFLHPRDRHLAPHVSNSFSFFISFAMCVFFNFHQLLCLFFFHLEPLWKRFILVFLQLMNWFGFVILSSS